MLLWLLARPVLAALRAAVVLGGEVWSCSRLHAALRPVGVVPG